MARFFTKQYIETEPDMIWKEAVRRVIDLLQHTDCHMITLQQQALNDMKSAEILNRMKVVEICPRCSVKHLIHGDLIIEYRKSKRILSKRKFFCQSCRKKENADYVVLKAQELAKYRISKGEKPWPSPPKFSTVSEVIKSKKLLPALNDLWRSV